ncbi:DUF934 domain-containing protein [Zoogloea sp.]|uniref:DUF934 domain-containing protein n=1 Tax=Zoogloea sp. TaxID=49181 RepID=UPI0035B2D6EA
MSAAILKHGEIVADRWQPIAADASAAHIADAIAAGGPLLLPLPLWLAHRAELEPQRAGVLLVAEDGLDAVLPRLDDIPLIAIHFPVFTDGRGYSLARLLRSRHGYRGELRAVGDVLRDQLYFLHRCGFDAFALRADQAVEEALMAFADYSWAPLGGRGEGHGMSHNERVE